MRFGALLGEFWVVCITLISMILCNMLHYKYVHVKG